MIAQMKLVNCTNKKDHHRLHLRIKYVRQRRDNKGEAHVLARKW